LRVLISLATGGAVLAFFGSSQKRKSASMFKTYWSWIFMAGIGLDRPFSWDAIPTIVGVTLLAIYAFKELRALQGYIAIGG